VKKRGEEKSNFPNRGRRACTHAPHTPERCPPSFHLAPVIKRFNSRAKEERKNHKNKIKNSSQKNFKNVQQAAAAVIY
jgi:L-lactate utilization protein LutB